VTLTEFGRRVEANGSGGRVHGIWLGLAPSNLIDGDLNGPNDYRTVLAEILEKRCAASSVNQICPGYLAAGSASFASASAGPTDEVPAAASGMPGQLRSLTTL
jgi:uncharacterized protein (DUF1501 family)